MNADQRSSAASCVYDSKTFSQTVVLSFLGVKFTGARIASVRITTGDSIPGPDDDEKHDIVMTDDFIYGEPQPLP